MLYNVLHDIELDKIRVGLASIPPENLVKAGLCVAMAYATLTLYDWFALRTLGYAGDVHVAHGFRGTADTMLHELGYNKFSDWSEEEYRSLLTYKSVRQQKHDQTSKFAA